MVSMFSNLFIILFITGSTLNLLIEILLEYSDFIWRKKKGAEVPSELKDYVSAETLKKTCMYEGAKFKNWIAVIAMSYFLELYLVFMGFYPAVYGVVKAGFGTGFVSAVIYLIIIQVPQLLLSVPFAYYKEFTIEKMFGFSKTTVSLWISDQIKSIILSIILMMPLIFAFTTVLRFAHNMWWLFLGIVYIVFSIVLSILYPLVIAPVFNKFTPVENEELKQKLTALMKTVGFESSSIKVMDASRRSGHSNAYFTGIGKSKGIVLYDTLVNQLTVDEIVAVVGHEAGHYKRHHIVKRLFIMIPFVLALLFCASLILDNSYLYDGFGFVNVTTAETALIIAGAMLLMNVFGGFSILLEPLLNGISRKDEFEADRYGAMLCGNPELLISALIKLNKENLSELTVPKIYSIFKYNHPPLLERIRHMRNAK